MKKYNKSKIMKDAWNIYRMAQKWVDKLSFGDCLRRAWAQAKKAARVFTGLSRMSRLLVPWRTPYWSMLIWTT